MVAVEVEKRYVLLTIESLSPKDAIWRAHDLGDVRQIVSGITDSKDDEQNMMFALATLSVFDSATAFSYRTFANYFKAGFERAKAPPEECVRKLFDSCVDHKFIESSFHPRHEDDLFSTSIGGSMYRMLFPRF